MTDYNIEDRIITKDDWENWLKMKEENSNRHLSNIPEPSDKKEIRYSVIEWHQYPQEKPEEYDEYLVTVKVEQDLFTFTTYWLPEGNTFIDFSRDIVAWAELPEPYKEET